MPKNILNIEKNSGVIIMRYIPATEEQKKEMLKEIGVSSFEDLIENIPQSLRLKEKLNIPEAMSESELEDNIFHIAKKNANFYSIKPLIGAGSYRHFIPEAVKFLLQREEFWTCYTPYQPELSQGTLQSIFEYQSYISRLTKMEVIIPSIYDGASATAEAALMSLRLTHKNKIIVSDLLHPHYRETIKTYLAPHETEIIDLPYKNGLVDMGKLKNLVDEDAASIIIQNPNFFGGIENMAEIAEIVHSKSALLINVIVESMSLGILKAPGEMNVDILVGNAQSFGMDLNYGGPYNAYLATKKEYIRQLPGRIIGETTDVDGKRVFVMTLRAREQDIRREKATSNICTNHNLNVIAANIYLSLMGTEGIYQLSLLNTKSAHYLEKLLLKSGKFEKVFNCPFYNEFLLKSKENISTINKKLLENNFIPPLKIREFYQADNLKNVLLFAVTEVLNRDELNRVAKILSE
ncbi:MAG: aminomethyl-transferring glycine dehydrogenase subunit GcvPA [Candidatus Atribacteria bacterium]|nr:aminomethyl-transferring glycine dehydrogenase subunit GcvPA [Candidatus Atribacteria bacterium]